MTAPTTTPTVDELGPIDYLVVEFPPDAVTGEALPHLVDLVDTGVIRILDLALVRREGDGSVTALDLVSEEGGYDLTVFGGASSGMLGQDDLDEAASAIEPGAAAAILVYENRWAAPFATALRRAGAQLVAGGRIPVQAILAALEQADAPSTS